MPLRNNLQTICRVQQITRYIVLRKRFEWKSSIFTRGYASHEGGLRCKYDNLINSGTLKKDNEQEKLVESLSELYKRLQEEPSSSTGFFSKLFGGSRENGSNTKGVYVYGSVGCGKTMLMDMFYEGVTMASKSRVHFNEFMIDVHKRIHQFKLSLPPVNHSEKNATPMDPIVPVAQAIASEVKLLCFDEFQVTDVADAMILKRLFGSLLENGVVMVATSNRKPEDLYKNGLQRTNFLPFIPILKKYCEVVHLRSNVDYRRLDLSDMKQCYLDSLHPDTPRKMNEIYHKLCNEERRLGHSDEKRVLKILGRDLVLTRTCGKVAFSTFEKLCMEPLGAIDYLTIAQEFDTVIVENIPILSAARKVETRRFITMVDNFYDKKIRLICSAERSIEQLFAAVSVDLDTDSNRMLMDDLGISRKDAASASLFTAEEEIFAFDRTKSRLSEMQTEQYWSTEVEEH